MNPKPLKVAIYDPSDSGGITHYTFQLAEGLTQAGCLVTIVTSESYELKDLKRNFAVWYLFKRSRLKTWLSGFAGEGTADSAAIATAAPQNQTSGQEKLAARLFDQLKSLRRALTLLQAVLVLYCNGTRVVHIQWIVDRRVDLLFIRMLRFLRFKIVYTVHDLLPHDEHTAANRAYYDKLYQYPHKLIVHSENNRKEMLDLFTVDPDKLAVIPHGCQRLFFDHFAISTAEARKQLGIPEGRRVILFFGLIKRYKGLEYLLEAFETIRTSCDNVMLLVAGKLYEENLAAFDHYSKLLTQYSSRADIKLVNEYIPLDKVSGYFSAADLVVLPYAKASQSGVLLSAWAAGKPVIVTDTGGLGEVVSNGKSGFVVAPKDAPAIAKAAIKMLNDPDLCQRLGAEAKRLADSDYSWKTIALKTLDLYQFCGAINGDFSRVGAANG